jgi:hypothetical protein
MPKGFWKKCKKISKSPFIKDESINQTRKGKRKVNWEKVRASRKTGAEFQCLMKGNHLLDLVILPSDYRISGMTLIGYGDEIK